MGKLSVVGIGPGDYDDMTVRADRALERSQVIVGYSVYVDLVKDRYPGKEYRTTAMTQEADRCREALKFAAEGRNVAVVCSGDSCVYGMAGLVYELSEGMDGVVEEFLVRKVRHHELHVLFVSYDDVSRL